MEEYLATVVVDSATEVVDSAIGDGGGGGNGLGDGGLRRW